MSATIEHDRLGLTIYRFVIGFPLEKKDHFLGSASELLDVLNRRAGIYPNDRIPKGWPKSPGALSSHLKRIAPALRKRRVEVEWLRDGLGNRQIKLWLTPTKPDDAPTTPNSDVVSKKPGNGDPDRRTDDVDDKSPHYSVEPEQENKVIALEASEQRGEKIVKTVGASEAIAANAARLSPNVVEGSSETRPRSSKRTCVVCGEVSDHDLFIAYLDGFMCIRCHREHRTIAPESKARLCALCAKPMGMSAELPGLGEICMNCLEARK